MTLYSFFIIIDTDDPSSFWVEMTKMNYRLRFSALKSSHIRKYGNNAHLAIHTKMSEPRLELPGYHKILKSNYTFYLLEKRHLNSEQANEHKHALIHFFKMKYAAPPFQGSKFRVSF